MTRRLTNLVLLTAEPRGLQGRGIELSGFGDFMVPLKATQSGDAVIIEEADIAAGSRMFGQQ